MAWTGEGRDTIIWNRYLKVTDSIWAPLILAENFEARYLKVTDSIWAPLILAENFEATNLKVDHIAEKTAGHDVVFDDDVDMNLNNIKNALFVFGIDGPIEAVLNLESGTNSTTSTSGGIKITSKIGPIFSLESTNATGIMDLGQSGARWKTVYSIDGEFSGNLNVDGDTTLDKLTAVGDTGLSNNVGDVMTITAGKGGSNVARAGGAVTLTGGEGGSGGSGTTPTGGAVNLVGGAGGGIVTTGYKGGDVNITGGVGKDLPATDSNGGDINIEGGAGGGTADEGVINLKSDTIFVGADAGLPYGCIDGADETITCTTQNTWYQVTFDTAGPANNTTISTANNDITINKTGDYKLGVTACFHTANAQDIEVMAKTENGTVDQPVHLFQTTGVAAKIENVAGSCIGAINATDTLELWVRCTSAGAIDVIFDHVDLNCVQVGG